MNALGEIAMGWGRVGLFGFGGGPGMIPMMQVECVQTHAWVTDEQFLEAIAASAALPGPISVKMSILIGAQVAGIPGAIAALLGVVVPAATLISVLAGVLTQFRDAPVVSGAMRAVQPAVIGLLAWTVVSLVPGGIRNVPSVLLAGGAFVALALKVHPAFVMVAALSLGALLLR
ncbi:MAG: chromate transporter [Deltaproteobacteria bacterium]|nr:chromate transporter [Deltaproteobacteria bacterium]